MTRNLHDADYWLHPPHYELSAKQLEQFTALPSTKRVRDGWLKCPAAAPKWVYLDWLARTKGLLFHGSNRADIEMLEPQKPNDNSPDEFSKRNAVFATDAPIWAMFFAITDRSQPGLRMLNSSFQVLDGGVLSESFHFFSVTNEVLKASAWRSGTLYLLPGETFERQPVYRWRGEDILEHQWASAVGVEPVAKVHVEPADFPFLSHVRGHDNAYVERRSAEEPYGFPWLE